ncbi:MAG TPA: sigma-70 family RNA polymerase sigma factor [Thermoanaerobaculia bacterium]
MDENELVERARRGDREAFRELVERHQDDVPRPPDEERWVEHRPDADPERAAVSGRLRADVAHALGRLTPAERDVFVLRQLNQLSIRETAEVTGRAEGTVKNLLFRALRRLRRELAVYGRTEEAT